MSRRAHNIPMPTSPTAPYTLALLSEYTHTLDSSPLDLSRSFADLRELDAVLSSSMAALTAKINQLTSAVENNTCSKEDRLWQLAEIAEEANRLKLGGEDKIRVACHAADGFKGHRTHMKILLDKIPDPDFQTIDLLERKTVYPHIATRAFLPVGMTGEGGRSRRRGAYGSLLSANNAVEASPSKRKRAAGRDDDGDVAKTPRKDRAGETAPTAQRQRNGARTKKTDRATSPTESLLSVASHLPHASNLLHSRQVVNGHARSGSTVSANKRRTNQTNGDHPARADPPTSHKDIYHAPPTSSSAHPSLPLPFTHNGTNGLHPHELNGGHILPNPVTDWPHGQLEGPGMPVARNFVGALILDSAAETATNTGGEGDGEGDDGRTYCFCDGVSYGEMIACDDSNCEREWFHITCIGLTVPPEGRWYCDTCLARRKDKARPNRGGKKRSGGARTGARNAST